MARTVENVAKSRWFFGRVAEEVTTKTRGTRSHHSIER
jgi:hypothetical protein